jgi:hypothetical protein
MSKLFIPCFLVATAVCGFAAECCLARVWTDVSGKQVNATYVRTVGSQVVLQVVGGGAVPVELAKLSQADQSHLNEQGVRVWTAVDGTAVLGEFVRVRDGDVYLRIEGKMVNQPFDQFSKGDRRAIRAFAAEKDLSSELPDANDEESVETRLWQDEKGNSVEGSFDDILPDGRVLIAGKLRTHVISVQQLSEEDHDHLREELDGTELAALVPAAKPVVPPSPPEAVASANNGNTSRPANSPITSRPTPTPSRVPSNGLSTRPTIPPRPVYEPPPYNPPTYNPPTYNPPVARNSPRGANGSSDSTWENPNSAYETGRTVGIIVRCVLIGLCVLSAVGGFIRYMFQ